MIRGTVISLHAFGAAVRLESGALASAPAADVEAHRIEYERAFNARKTLQFERREGRRPTVVLAPNIRDDGLEEQIAAYLKASEEHHFLQKKPRAERRRR